MLFSRVMQLAGLERPWDPTVRRPLPERFHPGGSAVTPSAPPDARPGRPAGDPRVHLLDLLLIVLLVGYAHLRLPPGTGRQRHVPRRLPRRRRARDVAAAHRHPRVDHLEATPLLRAVVLIAGVFILASIGQALAVGVGGRLRSQLRVRPAQAFDAVLGAVAVVIAVSVLFWFIAGALRGGAPAPLARAIGESRVLRTIDTVVPPQTSRLFAGFREVLDREGFPRVFEGLAGRADRPGRARPTPTWPAHAGVRGGRRLGHQDHRRGGGLQPRPGGQRLGGRPPSASSPTPTSWPACDRHAAHPRHRHAPTPAGSWSSTPSATSRCWPSPACPPQPLRPGRRARAR